MYSVRTITLIMAWIATTGTSVAVDMDIVDSKIAEGAPTAEIFDLGSAHQRSVDCGAGEVYDDSSTDGAIGLGGKKAGFVQLFTPSILPYRYESFCVCLHRAGVASSTIFGAEVVFYDDDGADGGPGTLLGSVTRSISGVDNLNSCDFFQLDLGDEAPLINTDRVYIGLIFDQDNYSNVTYGVDNTETTTDRPFYHTYDGVFFHNKVGSVFESYRALMMRAEGAPVCNETIPGVLAPQSPHWDRVIYYDEPVLNCEAISTDSGNNDMAYEAIPITSPTGGLLTAEITENSSVIDTFIYLYCEPFDPLNPSANLLAADDDGGVGSLSMFAASDGINLAPDTTYHLIVSTFTTSTYGSYELCLGGDFTRVQDCSTELTGTLNARSPHYDRIISNTPSLSCSAITADSAQNNMPYTAFTFEANIEEYFEASVQASGTSIIDPVMTLYCDPFDPEAPGDNVVAYDDNDGDGMLPAFTRADAILLTPGTRYWLILSTWQGADADGGDFTLCFGSDVTVAYPIAACDEDSIFGNTPVTLLDHWNAFNIGDSASAEIYDNFAGLSDPIRTVTWFGFIAPPSSPSTESCGPGPDMFELQFLGDVGGLPNASVYQETVPPVIFPTGIQYREDAQFQLMRFTAGLASDVFLTDGWLRIAALDASECSVYWLLSEDGDGNSVNATPGSSDFVALNRDHAFCLSSTFLAQHAADTDNNYMIGLSELLRVIQFFNSDGYHCDPLGEDGYAPGPGNETCSEHSGDYNPADFEITLTELLRVIQLFNSGGYHTCPEGEDGFCPGL